MITEEEKLEIINLAVEKSMLILPEVVGNLLKQHAAMSKLNSQFYKDHPEFTNHKDIVVSVIEMLDARAPLRKHEELLIEAVPEIKKRIELVKTIDITSVTSPNRDFSKVNFSENINGAI
jgi:hypothetical protein